MAIINKDLTQSDILGNILLYKFKEEKSVFAYVSKENMQLIKDIIEYYKNILCDSKTAFNRYLARADKYMIFWMNTFNKLETFTGNEPNEKDSEFIGSISIEEIQYKTKIK